VYVSLPLTFVIFTSSQLGSEWLRIWKGKAYLRPSLPRTHLILHIRNLLLLRERKRPRHTEQQRARAEHEQRLAAEPEGGGHVAGGGVEDGGDGGAGCGGDDVAQREETLGEGLVAGGGGVFVGGGDLGVCWVLGGGKMDGGFDMGGCTSVGVVVFLVVWADLLCLEGLVLDFDEFDHCGGCVVCVG
jgi:hypothetical protein